MKRYDFVVVGSGLTGSVVARKLAESNKKVLIIEKRSHIGGNVYDEYDENGVLVQRYGVHVFHTDKEDVFSFLSKFTSWNNYAITCLANIKDKMTDVPFNFRCIDTFYSDEKAKELKAKLLKEFDNIDRVPVIELLNSKDEDIKEFGNFLFENDYKPYTCKQWGRKPEEIDISILNRVKVALSYDNRYFSNKYQCMPKEGFTKMMENMINHKNITVLTNTDVNDLVSFENGKCYLKEIEFDKMIYTGALDRLFRYKFGQLPYRTLRFEYKTYDVDKYLDAPFVVYPLHKTMTRMTEFKSITMQKVKNKTTVVYEYPREYSYQDDSVDPYYPIICDKNVELFNKYKDLASNYENLILCGRLADYKYYDMDNAVSRGFEIFEEIKEK